MLMALLAALQAAPAFPPALPATPQTSPAPTAAAPMTDAVLDRMVALYDEVCLKSFPDDKTADAAMTARGATRLSQSEVRIYLRNDPGFGWVVSDGDSKFVVTIESPPYHACGVRRELPAPFPSLATYSAAIDRFKTGGASFMTMPAMDVPNGDLKSHMEAQMRIAGGNSEILMVVTDTRKDGTVEIRFVRQLRAMH